MNDDERPRIACGQAAEKAPAVAGRHLELSLGDERNDLVPLDVNRPRIVGLVFEPSAMRLDTSPVIALPLASVTTSVFGWA